MMYVSENDQKYINLDRTPPQYFVEFIESSKRDYECGCSWRCPASEYFTLIYLISGKLSIESHEIFTDKNSVLFIPKFSNLKISILENSSIIHITFNTSLDIAFLRSKSPFVLSSSHMFLYQFEKLYQNANFQVSFSGAKEAMLLSLISELNKSPTSSSEVILYEKALEWVENNSDKNITAEDVANALNRSRAYLNRIIKSVDGSCLSEKIISSRIKRIKNLCSVENLTLTEISQKLDFYSPELLCKFFKYHTGMSVSDYRNRYR